MSTGRVLFHNREIHLDVSGRIEIGDSYPVIRGNGPREGDQMGTATVSAINPDGSPQLDLS